MLTVENGLFRQLNDGGGLSSDGASTFLGRLYNLMSGKYLREKSPLLKFLSAHGS